MAAQRVRLCELLIGSVATTYQDWLGPAAADVAEARSRCHVAWTKNELDEASRLVSDSEQKHRSSAAFHQRHSLATDARKQIARLQEQGNVTTRPTDAGYGYVQPQWSLAAARNLRAKAFYPVAGAVRCAWSRSIRWRPCLCL